MITVSEFRKNIKEHLDSVLVKGSPLFVTRGGMVFKISVQLPEGIAEAKNIQVDKEGIIRKVDPAAEMSFKTKLKKFDTPSIPQPTPVKPIVKDAKKNFDFCKHGSVKGLCKKGCK